MASATYKINGKFDKKPISAAEAAMIKLGAAANALKTALGGIVIAKALQGVNALMNGVTEAFTAQNKALTNFRKSVANNAKMTAKDVDSITSKLGELSTGNFFDGDSLNNAASSLINLKLGREQIEETLDAATELAAAGIMPLQDATKALAKSLNGELEGSLKDIAPELGNLTAEQLKNGDAIKVLKERYSGFRDEMSQTFEGRDTQFANTFGDLQASIGGIKKSFDFLTKGSLIKPFQELTAFIENNRKQIINFVLNLPELVKTSLIMVKDVLVRLMDSFPQLGEYVIGTIGNWLPVVAEFVKAAGNMVKDVLVRLMDSFPQLGEYVIGTIGNWLPVVAEFAKAAGNLVIGAFDVTFGNLGRLFYNKVILNIKEALQNLVDDFVSKHPTLSKILGVKKLEFDLTEKAYSSFKKYSDEAGKNVEKAIEKAKDASKTQLKLNNKFASNFKDITDKAVDDLKNNVEKAKDASKTQLELNNKFASNFKDITDKGVDDLKKILNKDLPADLEKALSASVSAAPTAAATTSGTTSGTTGESSKDPGTLDYIAQVTSGLSSLGSTMKFINDVIQAILSGNWLTFIIGLIVQLLQAVMENSDTVKAFFDGFSSMIGVFAKKIAPMLAQILEPLLGLFESLGVILDVVALIVKALTPILTLLAKAINAVFKAVAFVIGGIVNGIIGIIRKVISVINKLPGVNISKPDYIDLTGSDYTIDTSASSSTDSATSSTASASASYTAARDIYMNVYYQNSYVNGDARAIALSIREEIKRAEQLGY